MGRRGGVDESGRALRAVWGGAARQAGGRRVGQAGISQTPLVEFCYRERERDWNLMLHHRQGSTLRRREICRNLRAVHSDGHCFEIVPVKALAPLAQDWAAGKARESGHGAEGSSTGGGKSGHGGQGEGRARSRRQG